MKRPPIRWSQRYGTTAHSLCSIAGALAPSQLPELLDADIRGAVRSIAKRSGVAIVPRALRAGVGVHFARGVLAEALHQLSLDALETRVTEAR